MTSAGNRPTSLPRSSTKTSGPICVALACTWPRRPIFSSTTSEGPRKSTACPPVRSWRACSVIVTAWPCLVSQKARQGPAMPPPLMRMSSGIGRIFRRNTAKVKRPVRSADQNQSKAAAALPSGPPPQVPLSTDPTIRETRSLTTLSLVAREILWPPVWSRSAMNRPAVPGPALGSAAKGLVELRRAIVGLGRGVPASPRFHYLPAPAAGPRQAAAGRPDRRQPPRAPARVRHAAQPATIRRRALGARRRRTPPSHRRAGPSWRHHHARWPTSTT